MTAPAAPPVHDRTLIDWITVTHENERDLRELLRGPVERRKVGLLNYPTSYQDGHGTILACGGPEPRPFMLRMTGKALEAWRAHAPDRDLLYHLAFNGAHCTRIDIARDTTGPWTSTRLWQLLEESRYLSSWRSFDQRSGLGGAARTVYCGSRQSETYLRVYDKKAEMEKGREVCPFDRLTRWEFEFKGDRALVVFDRLSCLMAETDETTGEVTWGLRELHASALAKQLTITTDPVDRDNKNQGRSEPLPRWLAFLAEHDETILAPGIDERPVRQQAHETGVWLRKQVASALAMASDVAGPDWISSLVERGRGATSAKHALFRETRDDARTGLWAALQ